MNDQAGSRCPQCGGGDVVKGLKLNQTADEGWIGLAYKALAILWVTEPLQADLCRTCGTVVRLFVKDPTRKWVQGS
jgi:hypothetical protein